MELKDLKFGTKITLAGNREYRIVDIRKEENKDYLVCCTNQKPILPIVFEYKIEGEKIKVRLEENNDVLTKIFKKMFEQNS